MPELEPLEEDWTRALAVAAHPDDLEYGVASAVARWTAQGKSVTYLMVTDGEAGIDGMEPRRAGPLRRDEEVAGAAEVGVHDVEFLGLPDGLVEADHALRRLLAAAIRRHRPEVLLGINFREDFGWPGWNHVDHRNVGVALLDAARDAGNRWLFTDLAEEGLEPWDGVRFVAFGGSPRPTHGVDVSASIDAGIASLSAHRTYLDALPEGTLGTDPDGFLRGSAREAGPRLGVELAVTFEVIPL
jgi:LmbE family N-acetylglucosaminyl deacetylase